MEAEYQHKILVVDDDAQVAKIIGKQLEAEGVEVVLADSSESALKRINENQKPFSLIISDQRSDEMQDTMSTTGTVGTEFLKQAKKITPDSQRFLLTACSDIGIIINAVNKGCIQRYISKPWDRNFLIKAVQHGLKRFERCLENDKLLGLAKTQNSKLYELNCELMEKTRAHNNESQKLKKEIERLESLIANLTCTGQIKQADVIDQIEDIIKNDTGIDTEKMTQLLFETIRILYDQFNEIATRNGFEMPIPKDGTPC
ncbi:MAG: response regulator [Desulfobacula sp.]|nr:response regulator [Desulfobacula sp.]